MVEFCDGIICLNRSANKLHISHYISTIERTIECTIECNIDNCYVCENSIYICAFRMCYFSMHIVHTTRQS